MDQYRWDAALLCPAIIEVCCHDSINLDSAWQLVVLGFIDGIATYVVLVVILVDGYPGFV